jgi:hypothetical protein
MLARGTYVHGGDTMSLEHVQQQGGELIVQPQLGLPSRIAHAGDHASERSMEFFTANIRNLNARMAYARAVWCLMAWCEARGPGLQRIRPIHVAA